MQSTEQSVTMPTAEMLPTTEMPTETTEPSEDPTEPAPVEKGGNGVVFVVIGAFVAVAAAVMAVVLARKKKN